MPQIEITCFCQFIFQALNFTEVITAKRRQPKRSRSHRHCLLPSHSCLVKFCTLEFWSDRPWIDERKCCFTGASLEHFPPPDDDSYVLFVLQAFVLHFVLEYQIWRRLTNESVNVAMCASEFVILFHEKLRIIRIEIQELGRLIAFRHFILSPPPMRFHPLYFCHVYVDG